MTELAEVPGNKKTTGRKILIAFVVLAALLLAGLIYWGIAHEFVSIPFNREGWAAYKPYKNDHTRKWMYSDLTQNYLKSGMTRDQVLRLLGTPEYQDADRFSYDFGPDSFPLPVDRTILYINFDKSGRVTDFGIGQS